MDDNIFTLKGGKIPEGIRQASPEDTGNPEILQAFSELKKLVTENKLEGMILVATTKDGGTMGTVAGLVSPTQMVGLLESVKLQLLMG